MVFKKTSFFFTCLLVLSTLIHFPRAQFYDYSSEAFGDFLIIGYVGKAPRTLNPYHVNNIVEKEICRLVYGNGLIQQPDRFDPAKALVDRFIFPSVKESRGKIWRYVLKRNINFQNGVPLRNYDVKFTFDMLRKWPGNILNRELDFSNIQSIALQGDLEVKFVLRTRDNNFDQKLSDVPILLRDYYSDVALKGFSYLQQVNPLGYGPFQFNKKIKDEIHLVPHQHYVFGRPFLNRVIFKFFDNEQELVDNFIQDKVDLMEVRDRVTAQRLYQILKNDIKIFPIPRPEKKVYFLLFNVKKFPFQERNIRRAIRLAVNSQEIVNHLVEQNGHVSYSLMDYTHSDFYKDLFRKIYQPNLSMDILHSDGWKINRYNGILEKNGRAFTFELMYEKNSYLEESIARSIKIHLADLGINVQPRPVNYTEKQGLLKTNQFEAAIYDYSYFEEDLYSALKDFYYSILRKKEPFLNYQSQKIEQLFKEANMNSGLRKQLIRRYQIYLQRDVPVVFLYFDDKIIYAVKNRFQNIRVTYSSGNMFFYRLNPLENWFVPKVLQKYPEW